MSTLVCRLAGPLQSWGEEARFNRRGTLPYPTYSGLLGLTRAALGHDRHGRDATTGAPAAEQPLRALRMAIRVDQPGRTLLDYHTVNPPPTHQYSWLSTADRARLATIAMGNGRPWTINGRQQTLQTWRTYVTGGVFTWLLHGDDAYLQLLAAALIEPYWPLSLGRKACLPDQPLVLGISRGGLADTATLIPATGRDGPRTLHVFHHADAADPAGGLGRTVTFADLPLGPHPHHRYGYQTRTVTTVEPTTMTRNDLLDWAKEHLT